MGDHAMTPVVSPAGRPPRALVVAYHFPPEGSIGTHRTLRLVRQLSERGWDVTVLTGTAGTYSAGCTIDPHLLTRVPSTVKVVRAPALRPFDWLTNVFGTQQRKRPGADPVPSVTGNAANARPRGASWLLRAKQRIDALLGIPDQHVGWLLPALAAGLAASVGRAPDVLYSTAPPWSGQLVSRALASLLRCPWVADFRDPWARAPWREGRLTAARRAAELFERLVIRRADAIVFTTRTNLEEYAAFYPTEARKFRLVRNGCDPDEFDGVTPLVRDGRFTLLHAGSLYGGRKPTALFSALAALRDRGVIDAKSFCFRQIGRVALSGFDMGAERTRLGLDGMVELVESQPRREILREMRGASCLLLLQPGTTVSIPGKLFEYLAAGRPILAIAEPGETADLVRASGCGLAVLPDDQEGIERAIESLVRQGIAAPAAPPVELFDGRLRTGELAAVLDHVAGDRVATHPAATASRRESLRPGARI
ncbi:MAG TPA: glycosyltransferase family 4 protein [Vicinamibacterales bacterium]|nr:glycosyltransferase family 4 protein [Vicinamibacterales bacterium]